MIKKLFISAAGFFLLPFLVCGQSFIQAGGYVSHHIEDFYLDSTSNLLYVVGQLLYVGEDSSYYVGEIATWDGANWGSLDSGNTGPAGNPVKCIEKYKGEFYIGGMFSDFRGDPAIDHLAKWDGSQWQGFGVVDYSILGMSVIDGELYVMGYFDTIAGIPAHNIAKYDGSTWSAIDTTDFNNSAKVAIKYNGNLYVAGNFNHSYLEEIAMWDGNQWQNVGSGIIGDAWVNDMIVYQGELYVGGYFFRFAGNAGDGIMKWDGSQWHDVGGGVCCTQVHEMMVLNGYLYVVGQFWAAGGMDAYMLARWDGTEWCVFDRSNLNTALGVMAYYKNKFYVAGGSQLSPDTLRYFMEWLDWDNPDTCGYLDNGLEELTELENASAYPNPTGEKITLDFSEKPEGIIHVRVFDITGKAVLRERLSASGPLTINLEALPNGLYLIKAETEEATRSFKVIKE